MKRVVITGLGIVSSIGNNKEEVLNNLKEENSGLIFNESFKENGLRSHVSGEINIDVKKLVPKRNLRLMSTQSAYSYISLSQAIEDSKLNEDLISNEKTGIIIGSGDTTTDTIDSYNSLLKRGTNGMSPFSLPKCMSSGGSASLASAFKIKGVNYSINSACTSTLHCIISGVEQILLGKQNIVFAGGSNDINWITALSFDRIGALTTNFNDNPEKSSRPYDKNRDGLAISGGGGIVVLEEYEHAKKRGAKIYAEVTGYGSNSDGFDMFVPSGEGAERCMKMALENNQNEIEYINTHGTSTPQGDLKELNAIKEVFKNKGYLPYISSTKSLTGHSLVASGVHEIIYCLLMMEKGFICSSKNIDNIENEANDMNVVRKQIEKELNTVMSNSFGFGGSNASLILSKNNI